MRANEFRWGFLLLAGIAIASGVLAQQGNVVWHEIQINVDENGLAQVRERFFFAFATTTELHSFEQSAQENGAQLSKWQRFNPLIYPHAGREDQTERGVITLNADPQNPLQKIVEYSYQMIDPLGIRLESRTERLARYEISTEKNRGLFVPFKVGTVIQIPKYTRLTVELPATARIEEALPAPAQRPAENVIVWQDTQSNQFKLTYGIPQKVPTIDLTRQVTQVLQTPLGQGILLVLALVLGVGVVFRKQVAKKIEDYLVEHSEPLGKIPSRPKAEKE